MTHSRRPHGLHSYAQTESQPIVVRVPALPAGPAADRRIPLSGPLGQAASTVRGMTPRPWMTPSGSSASKIARNLAESGWFGSRP